MSQDKKSRLIPRGDQVPESDVVMDAEWEIRSRCESVHDVVTQGLFPLSKALKAYNIGFQEYIGFLLMKNVKSQIIVDDTTFTLLMKALLGLIDTKHSHFEATRKIMEDVRKLHGVK